MIITVKFQLIPLAQRGIHGHSLSLMYIVVRYTLFRLLQIGLVIPPLTDTWLDY